MSSNNSLMSGEGCAFPVQVLPEVTGRKSPKGAFRHQTGLSSPGSRPLLASTTQSRGLLLLCTAHLLWWGTYHVHPRELERAPSVAECSAWHELFACKDEMCSGSWLQRSSSECAASTGGLRLWTHFDVMSNVLCQIRGTKRIRLWPPSEVSHTPLVCSFPMCTSCPLYSSCLSPGVNAGQEGSLPRMKV